METQEKVEKKQTKIILPDHVLDLALNAQAELKQRGLQARLDELFSELLLHATKEYFDKQVQKLTPDEYLLELAKKTPEGLAYLVKQAKKVLETIENGGEIRLKRERRTSKREIEATV